MCRQIHYLLTIFVVFSTIKRGKFLEFFCFSSVDLTTFANFLGKKKKKKKHHFLIIKIEKKIMVYINTSVIILVLKVLYTNIHGTWNRLVSKAWQKKKLVWSMSLFKSMHWIVFKELPWWTSIYMLHDASTYIFLKYFSFNHPIELTPTIAPLWMNGACIGQFFSFGSCSPAPP